MALVVCLAGRAGLEVDGVAVADAGLGQLGRVAFAFLVTERQRPVDRHELAEVLWGERLPATWESALRTHLTKLRGVLRDGGLADGVLAARAGCYQLRLPDGVVVDVEEAAANLDDARASLVAGDPDAARRHAAAVVAVAERQFLPGAVGAWVEDRRAQLRRVRVAALEVLSYAETETGDWAAAVRAAEEAVALEPLRESAYVRLMAAHAGAGSRGEALRAYSRCRQVLVEELGVDPSETTEAAYLALLGEESGAPARHMSPGVVGHNLPVPRSSFVGRRVELAEISGHVFARQSVTLTGVGGCGKTRLALEVAASLLEHFPDGVYFVDLSVVSEPDLVGQAFGAGLGLHLADTTADGLVGHLAERRLLVVLDNCEHVLDACADLVDSVLARCSELRVLATSREALGIDGEQVVRVPSLDIDTDARSLFLDRARDVRPELDIDAASETAVVEICTRLDGIPLAIELAAARTAHLSPAEILERLSDRFRLLTGGRRNVPRQQTLAAAIDWSYSLLSAEEKTLLRRLAVFRGSFSLRSAEAICESSVDQLGSLVAKSLVNAEAHEAATRYRLLETVRLFAEEQLLEAGETELLRSRHRDWFLEWIEGCPVGPLVAILEGHQLLPDADNLGAALDWCCQEGRFDLFVRIASRMVGYWFTEMRVAEMGARWEQVAVAIPALDPDLRAAALTIGAQHATAVGDFIAMERLSAEVLHLASPNSWVAAWAWAKQALYWTLSEPERGRRCIEEGRKAAVAADVPEFEAMIAVHGVNLMLGRGYENEGLELVDALEKTVTIGSAMDGIVSGLLASFGETERAAARFVAASPPRGAAQRFTRARVAALIAWGEHRPEAMGEHLLTQSAIARHHAFPLGEAACVIGFAALAIEDGDHARASRLLASVAGAGAFPFRTALDVATYLRCIAALRGALDPATARRCRAEGAAISVSEALDAELERLAGRPHPDRNTD